MTTILILDFPTHSLFTKAKLKSQPLINWKMEDGSSSIAASTSIRSTHTLRLVKR